MNSLNLKLVFVFKNREEYEKNLRDAKEEKQNEDYSFCISRERGQEILCCQEQNFPYELFFLDNPPNCSIFKDYYLIFRGGILQVNQAKNYVKGQLRGKTRFLIRDSVLMWPKDVKSSYLKRKYRIIQHKNLSEQNNFPCFIKTSGLTGKDKFATKIAKVIENEKQLTDEIQLAVMHLPEDYPLFVSDILKIKSDSKGKREYRCWVSGNRISSISRYLDYDTDYSVPKRVVEFAIEFINEHRRHFPNCYVVDIAETEDKGPVVIELNDIESSGRYAKNHFSKFIEDISKE